MAFNRKHILSMQDMTREEIEEIIRTAAMMRPILESSSKRAPHLQGKSIINLFYENSTRTRTSFELACKYTQAVTANIAAAASSVAKGETLLDTVKNIEALGADVVVIRHPHSGAPHFVAENVNCSIVNAGDGVNEHPTQSLLDIYTIMRQKGSLEGLKVAIVGDVLHSRVARSNVFGMATMGAQVTLCGPATLLPRIKELGLAKFTTSLDEALEGADVVMPLRIQSERQDKGTFPSTDEYFNNFGVSTKRLAAAKPDYIVMHPGPLNRGVEITSEVADGPHSVILEQVTNGVAVRMAVLYLLTRRGSDGKHTY